MIDFQIEKTNKTCNLKKQKIGRTKKFYFIAKRLGQRITKKKNQNQKFKSYKLIVIYFRKLVLKVGKEIYGQIYSKAKLISWV